MRSKLKNVLLVGAFLLTSIGVPSVSMAVPVTVMEEISDFKVFGVDLTRTRTSSNGINEVETNDATIIAENAVDGNFGKLNKNDVSYKHLITWINPAVKDYISATLDIRAFGVLGGNEILSVDSIDVMPLVNGTLSTLLFSLTTVTSTDPVLLDLLFNDGVLNIDIDKNRNAGFLGSFNKSNIFQSKLTVVYEPVPEPSTMLLLGTGLAGVIGWRMRKSST